MTYIKNEFLLIDILDELDRSRQASNTKKGSSNASTMKSNFTGTVGSTGNSRKASFASDTVSNFGMNRSVTSQFNGYEIIHFKM
jgi:hypothetical protein